MRLRGIVTVLAPALTAVRVRRIVGDREHPDRLVQRRDDVEAYGIGAMVSIGCLVLAGQLVAAAAPLWVVALLALVALFNGVACAAVLIAVARSRLQDRVTWGQLDYIERHAPRAGRPPETIEEHDAVRMRSAMS
ncbi:hypothetical protein ACQP1U_06295 [Actinomycetota bacterium]